MMQGESTQMAFYLGHLQTQDPFGLETGQGRGFGPQNKFSFTE